MLEIIISRRISLAAIIGICKRNIFTLVNVYVDLVVFTRLPVLHRPEVAENRCKYYIEKHAICLKDYRITPF